MTTNVPTRSAGIDLFRFIGAFFIVLLHSEYGDLSTSFENVIRLSARWAVPFFFIVSGYFLAPKMQNRDLPLAKIENSLMRMIWILLVSSVFYFLLNTYFTKALSFSIEQFLTGTNFHLWFLGSLIFGFLSIWFIYRLNKGKYMYIISITILIIALYTDIYDVVLGQTQPYELFRFLLSIPFMFGGILLAKLRFVQRSWIFYLLLVAASFAITLLEVYHLNQYYGLDWWEPQLTIGSVIMAYGIFALSLQIKVKPNLFSKMGAQYSLLVYLYHPFVLYLMKVAGNNLLPQTLFAEIERFNPIICFTLTMGGIAILHKFTPWMYHFLDGSNIKAKPRRAVV